MVPVWVGTGAAAAVDRVAWLPALAALLGAIGIQIGTNFANDVFDYEQGADGDDRLGPVRAVATGLLSPVAMRWGMGVAFGLSFVIGIYLVSVGGWPIVIIGLASILSGIFYTATRYSLAYLGLGDLFVLVFFGFLAVGATYYLQTGSLAAWVLAASIPVGAWATNIIVVNNLRDRATDAKVGKRTLAVRFGRRFSLTQYTVLAVASFAVPLAFVLAGASPWLLLPLLAVPEAWMLGRALARTDGRSLNPLLGRSARMLLLVGAPWGIGLALGGPP
jgi:1,4-dihydroxy-2-naphthoate octaprenyltransferase